MQGQDGLLGLGLRRDEASVRLLRRRPDGPRVGGIGLVAQHERPHALRVQQAHLVPQCGKLPRPPVGAATGLQGNHGWCLTGKVWQDVVATELDTLDFARLDLYPMQLKNLFGDIHADHAIFHFGSSCSCGELRHFHFGTLMPLQRGSISPPTANSAPLPGGGGHTI